MTRAHSHRQVNVHLDTVEDADVIEHIEMQPSMVGYIRELVRRDMYDERLDYAALKMSELQAKNNRLREMAKKIYGGYLGGHYMISCNGCEYAYEDYGGYTPLDPDYCVFVDSDRYVGCWKRKRLEAEMRELGVEL